MTVIIMDPVKHVCVHLIAAAAGICERDISKTANPFFYVGT